MKMLAGFGLIILMAGAVPALADHPGAATGADLRMLRAEVDRLDDSLLAVDSSHARAREFRQREDEIRDRLTRLSTQIRRHRQDPDRGVNATKSDVDRLREDIVALRRDVESSSRSAERGDLSVPDGTEIHIRLEEPLSSRTARREDRVVATVVESVRQDGRVAIPAGSEVRGTVVDVQSAGRAAQGARMEMSFDSVRVDDRTVDIRSKLVKVDESRIDKKRTGLGAILGGVVGGVLDGTKGAVIGAILGGGGAVVASKGEEVELPAGTLLTLRLERPIEVGAR